MLEILNLRSRILKNVREIFNRWNYTEVETPIMVPYRNPDSNVENVKTLFHDFQGREKRWFLHTSPEFFMKRLIWYGAERIFQITKVFRDGEITELHNVEFTMLEWYRTGENYRKGMEETISLITKCGEALGVKEVEVKGRRIDLSTPVFLSVEEAFLEFSGVSPFEKDELKKLAKEEEYETAFFKVLVEKVEPGIGELPGPVVLYDYPKEFGAFSKRRGEVAERFEVYVGGVEIANGYTEMTEYEEYIQEMDKKEGGLDRGFLELLKEKPLPPCEGVALGVDRLIMVLSGKEKISDVIPFSIETLLKESNP